MKIALFHNLHPGGAKRALYEQARRLRERGHSLDGYTLSTAAEQYLPLKPLCQHLYTYELESPADGWERRLDWGLKQGWLWKVLGPRNRSVLSAYRDVHRLHLEQDQLEQLYARMAAEIDQRGYDLVFVHQCHLSLSPALLRFLKTPTLYYAADTLRYVYEWSLGAATDWDARRDSFFFRNERGQTYARPFLGLLRRKEQQYVRSTRAASRVLVNSWYSREAFVRTTGINPSVCYLGVETEFFSPDPAVAREAVVLSVGEIAPTKRHDFIIDALGTVPVERRPRLRIIGYEHAAGRKAFGPVAKELMAHAERLGVALQIDTDVTDEQLRDGYRQAKVVAFAPQLEPFGFIPLEAMACATPVVGVSEGGVRESVQDGVTGLLTGRDPAAFGTAIDRICADDALARRLGENGREMVLAHWTWDKSADELEGWMTRLRSG